MIRLQGDYADADREERYARQSRAEQTRPADEQKKGADEARAAAVEGSEQ